MAVITDCTSEEGNAIGSCLTVSVHPFPLLPFQRLSFEHELLTLACVRIMTTAYRRLNAKVIGQYQRSEYGMSDLK